MRSELVVLLLIEEDQLAPAVPTDPLSRLLVLPGRPHDAETLEDVTALDAFGHDYS